ncbi:MAG: hypothetical protein JOZ77_09415 [Candidatus Eremiobacteraeota bacterium]|nr:hypothetical protein [Candidatus Eremiobacteraeota bacterium]
MTPLVPSGAVGQPLVVVTDWGARGALPLALLCASIGAAAFFYWRALHRAQPPAFGLLLACATLALAIAWSSPVLFSSDVYAYAAYGEMARLGLNVYAHAPAASADVLIHAAQAQWVSAFPICVYGPAFVTLARWTVTVFGPLGVLAQLDAFRVASSAAFLLCIALIYAAYRGDSASRLRAAATFGLNPVAIWCAVEGHNDALALAIVLLGFALLRERSASLAGAVAALSASIKLPGAAAAIALGVVTTRARIGVAVGIAIVAAFSIPLVAGVATQAAAHGVYAPQASLQAIIAPLGRVPAGLLAATLAATLAMRGIFLLRRHDDEGWIWLGIGAWMLVPNPYPWYATWLLALAALAPTTPAAWTAIGLSFTSLLRYLPDAIATPAPPLSVALGIAATLPLLTLVAPRWYNERLV